MTDLKIELGHADDCQGCALAALTDEDREWFAANSYKPAHRRREPPKKPRVPIIQTWRDVAFPMAPVLITATAFLLGWIVTGIALLALAGFWLAVCYGALQQEKQEYLVAWRSDLQQWEVAQEKAWYTRRVGNLPWPCPKCGDETCQRHMRKLDPPRIGQPPSKVDPVKISTPLVPVVTVRGPLKMSHFNVSRKCESCPGSKYTSIYGTWPVRCTCGRVWDKGEHR